MITVNHYANNEWSVTGIPLDRNILANSLYHYGELKPNYPLPALRVSVTIRDWIVITSHEQRDQYGLGSKSYMHWKET